MKAGGSQERGVEGQRGLETGDDEPLQRQREIKMEMRRHQSALWSPTRRVWKPGKSDVCVCVGVVKRQKKSDLGTMFSTLFIEDE